MFSWKKSFPYRSLLILPKKRPAWLDPSWRQTLMTHKMDWVNLWQMKPPNLNSGQPYMSQSCVWKFFDANSAKIRRNLRNSEQLGSCSILLRFHSNPPDSRAYWYKSVTNSWDFKKVVRGGPSYISPTTNSKIFWAFSECFYHLLQIRSNLRNSELDRSSDMSWGEKQKIAG